MQKFKPVSNDQLMLLPPSVEDFIPSGHLARVISDVVETIDVKDIEARYSHLGQNRKTDVEAGEVEVKEVVLQQVVEEPEPPPPNLTSHFKTLQEWLFNLCNTEKPDDSILTYNFGLFESKDHYILVLTSSKLYGKFQDSVTIDFEPSIMYYPLPQSDYKNLNREQVVDRIMAQLKEFTQTVKFKHSFFAKAKAIITDFNGENLVKVK